MKPRALDLFCGAGGASRGLQAAGFHVTGVDIAPQSRYCGDEFFQEDVLHMPFWKLLGFDFIWASPVCKGYTRARRIHGHKESYPLNQIPRVRDMLQATDSPYVIENVVGAPLINPFTLCGLMFGLRVLRHRHFEASFLVSLPRHPQHAGTTNSHRGMGKGGDYVCVAGHNFLMSEAKAAMGIDWMVQSELSQAIPPAYSCFIGRQILEQMERAA
jgi:DNA (cytosine-5)-methyltransferase 1